MQNVYLGLCLVGTILPFWPLLPWLRDHGLDVPLFIDHMFANGVAAAFSIDVLLSTVVLWVLVLTEGVRRRVPLLWAPLVANLVAGVCSGLPLFLYLRERRAQN
jgi:hypothetical protein